ncbi:MAG: outer membrane protein assembly factor BamD [Gammaproteobacteria bacterium]|nr:outer membrane protein assembly factor BamD [Gammaproteobacteria bacterium]
MQNLFITVKLAVTILSFLFLISCSSSPKDPTEDKSAAELYAIAKEQLDSGNFSLAIENYETLESRYPFGVYAIQAQLDVAYAYYLYDEPESATAAADRFIKLHPRHESVDYAYYLKGLVNFGLQDSIMDKFHTRDLADYDKSIMQQSYQDFSVLVNRFPDSEYAPDAIKRMAYLRNQMARAEIKIAEFYLSRRAWIAAANRAKALLETYQGSASVKRALQVQIIAYEQLQLNDLAEDTRRVLIYNYGEAAANIKLEDFISS